MPVHKLAIINVGTRQKHLNYQPNETENDNQNNINTFQF